MKSIFGLKLRFANTGLVAALAVASAAVAGNAGAQQTGVAPNQVPGSQLQLWLDQKFAYAGVNVSNRCYLMTAIHDTTNVQFLSCPDGYTAKLTGPARVVGNTLCTTFPYPDRPVAEQCREWHRIGENKYELRDKGSVISIQYILTPR